MSALDQFKQQFDSYWQERSAQERKTLTLGALFVLAVLIYLALIAPAWEGKKQLEAEIPKLRMDAAQMQALIGEAKQYAGLAQNAPAPVTKDVLEAMMNQRGLPPANIAVTSDYIKVQMSNVPFANLVTWIGEIQKVHRLMVLDATIVSQATLGNVNANLTLRQIGQ